MEKRINLLKYGNYCEYQFVTGQSAHVIVKGRKINFEICDKARQVKLSFIYFLPDFEFPMIFFFYTRLMLQRIIQ